jgi:chorismate mutase
MRRVALVALVFLSSAPAAHAGCGATSTLGTGKAPLVVTFTATCEAVAYSWDFGDGEQGVGRRVQHVCTRLGALLPELLPARLRSARVSRRAAVPGLARVRAHSDVDRANGLRSGRIRKRGDRLHMSDDGTLNDLRDQISAIDRAIFAAVNERLRLVAQLKQVKQEQGLAFVDPEREAALLEERLRENNGPLSADGLRAFYVELLALVKREAR